MLLRMVNRPHALLLHVKRYIWAHRAQREVQFLRPSTRRSVRRPAGTDDPNIRQHATRHAPEDTPDTMKYTLLLLAAAGNALALTHYTGMFASIPEGALHLKTDTSSRTCPAAEPQAVWVCCSGYRRFCEHVCSVCRVQCSGTARSCSLAIREDHLCEWDYPG